MALIQAHVGAVAYEVNETVGGLAEPPVIIARHAHRRLEVREAACAAFETQRMRRGQWRHAGTQICTSIGASDTGKLAMGMLTGAGPPNKVPVAMPVVGAGEGVGVPKLL